VRACLRKSKSASWVLLIVTLVSGSVITGSAGSVLAQTHDLQQAYLAACEKIKNCARRNIDAQELGPQMMQMIEATFEQMCTAALGFTYGAETEIDADVALQAGQCMSSIRRLSCQALDEEAMSTPECEAYESALEAMSQ
jgi:hypothetical protein